MAVRDFARAKAVTAAAEESIREAARRMDSHGVGCLVVVDAEERPVGMLTDRDIVVRVLRRRRDPDATRVGDVMQQDVTVVRESTPLVVAVRRMRRDGLRRTPLVDEQGRLCGIITSDDVLQLLSSELAGIAEAVRSQFPAEPDRDRALPPAGG